MNQKLANMIINDIYYDVYDAHFVIETKKDDVNYKFYIQLPNYKNPRNKVTLDGVEVSGEFGQALIRECVREVENMYDNESLDFWRLMETIFSTIYNDRIHYCTDGFANEILRDYCKRRVK